MCINVFILLFCKKRTTMLYTDRHSLLKKNGSVVLKIEDRCITQIKHFLTCPKKIVCAYCFH